jgi:hypothetical protein
MSTTYQLIVVVDIRIGLDISFSPQTFDRAVALLLFIVWLLTLSRIALFKKYFKLALINILFYMIMMSFLVKRDENIV